MTLPRRVTLNRRVTFLLLVPPVAGLLAVLGFLLVGAFQAGPPGAVQAQEGGQGVPPPHSTMEQRLGQIIRALRDPNSSSDVIATAVDNVLPTLTGGMLFLPSQDVPETQEILPAFQETAMGVSAVLQEVLRSRTDLEPGLRGRILDTKLHVEEITEVAQALAQHTINCGEGDPIGDPQIPDQEQPCNELLSILPEDDASVPGTPQGQEAAQAVPPHVLCGFRLCRSYSVKLRSGLVPQPVTRRWEELVLKTEPLAPRECAVVFKETRGLMLRLHFDRVIVVGDPWVTVYGFPRTTRIPIWRLEWQPSEYIKQFNICNNLDSAGNAQVRTTHQQIVKQDRPLNFFWGFYAAPDRPILKAD